MKKIIKFLKEDKGFRKETIIFLSTIVVMIVALIIFIKINLH